MLIAPVAEDDVGRTMSVGLLLVPPVQSMCLVQVVFVCVCEQGGVGGMETVGWYRWDAAQFSDRIRASSAYKAQPCVYRCKSRMLGADKVVGRLLFGRGRRSNVEGLTLLQHFRPTAAG